MFSTLKAVKFVASGIAGMGTKKIIQGVIEQHVKTDTLVEKVTVTAASWVISGFVTAAIKKYTDDSIDNTVKVVTDIVDQFKLNDKLKRVNSGESTFSDEGLDSEDFMQDENEKWVPRPKDKHAEDTTKEDKIEILREILEDEVARAVENYGSGK